jgi:hypothetical protein
MTKYVYNSDYARSLVEYMHESPSNCLDGWLSKHSLPSYKFYAWLGEHDELYDAYSVAKSYSKAALLKEFHVGCSDRYYNANATDKLFTRKFCTKHAKIRGWDSKKSPAEQSRLVLEQLAEHAIDFDVADVMLTAIERTVRIVASTEHEERIGQLEAQLQGLLEQNQGDNHEPQIEISESEQAIAASSGRNDDC